MAIQLILTFQKQKKAFIDCFRQPAGCSFFNRHRRFLCLLWRIPSLTFGSLWLVFRASRIFYENLEPGGPSSYFLLPVLEFHASSLPPKRMLPLKKMAKRECLIAGDHSVPYWGCYQMPSWLRTLCWPSLWSVTCTWSE